MVQGSQGAGAPLSPQSSVLSPPQPAGQIFDLGYQRYDGPREGRRRAVTTLFWSGLRRVWGIGRPFRSKLAPWALLATATVPALVQLGIVALVNISVVDLIRYENYYGVISLLTILFCAIVGPELLVPDIRQKTLSLYFSRAITRIDYLASRAGALLVALLIMALVPQALLFAGRTFADTDPFGYMRDNLDIIPRILLAGLVISLFYSSIALAIASYANRRVWAAGGFVALILVSTAVFNAIHETLANEASRYLSLLALGEVPQAASRWIFGVAPEQGSLVQRTDLPMEVWFLAALGYITVALAVLVRRYLRLTP